jgi:hypothetical protein
MRRRRLVTMLSVVRRVRRCGLSVRGVMSWRTAAQIGESAPVVRDAHEYDNWTNHPN